jgi:Protein of unknown function (DUF2630)
MNDSDILQHIQQLVKEEHELMNSAEEQPLSEEQRARMEQLQVNLDQLWDLLRQRRARREFGLNPNEATERDPSTVEHYLQ